MSWMDEIEDKAENMKTDMSERYEELKAREASGDLDDGAKQELSDLRKKFDR